MIATLEAGTITLREAYEEYFADAKRRGNKAIHVAAQRAAHVLPTLGNVPISEITTLTMRQLQKQLADKNLAAATVNGVLHILMAVLNEAARNGHLMGVPPMPRKLRVPPPRRTFLERSDFDAIYAELEEPGRSVFEFSYLTGWRKNEVVSLTWAEVSLEGRCIELAAARSKNGQPRPLPLTGRIAEIIEAQAAIRKGSDYVFNRDGERYAVPTFSQHFRDARKRAGREHIRFHDTRRTAARNLVRAGVPERVAMQVTGHSRQMFDRYNVTSERDLELAVEAVSAPINCGASTSLFDLTGTIPIAHSVHMPRTGEPDKDLVKRIRNQLRMSKTEIAAAMGVSESSVRQWESGERDMRESHRRLLILLAEKHLAEAKA